MAKSQNAFQAETTSERTQRAIEIIYATRFTNLKKAMNHSLSKQYINAIEEYKIFFKILANYHQCLESELSPIQFKKGKDISEVFLISQAYWDLSKIYDKDPKFIELMKRSLQKFENFSQGFKFQYANSQLVDKFLKSGKCRNKSDFEKTFGLLRKKNDKCFVATYCFGANHPITNDLRLFKYHILNYRWGRPIVRLYYQYSPKLLNFCRKYPFLGVPLKVIIFYPLLFLTYLFWDKKFINRLR